MAYISNILNYIDWRGDLDFCDSPFNEIDALILSALSYIEFDEIVSEHFTEEILLKDSYELFLTHKDEEKYNVLGVMIPNEIFDLYEKMSKAHRYQNLKMFAYRKFKDLEHEVQFSAIVLQNDQFENFVIFRGTDDSVIGWKEDFNLGYMDVIPAQTLALDYLNEIGNNCYGTYYVCGHSKGGNLAVFSSALCDESLQSNIIGVYNLDGPGFSQKFLLQNGYQEINSRTYWYLPHESIVGTLMHHGTNQYVVQCSMKGGVLQHNPFMWHVEGTKFIYEQYLSEDAIKVHVATEQCFNKLSKEELQEVIDTIFSSLDHTDVLNLSDFKISSMSVIADTFKNLNEEQKNLIKDTMILILKAYITA